MPELENKLAAPEGCAPLTCSACGGSGLGKPMYRPEIDKPQRDRCYTCQGSGRRLGDFDVWYAPCDRCGYDTAKSSKADVKYCWRCGNRVYRDFTDRALKSLPNVEPIHGAKDAD